MKLKLVASVTGLILALCPAASAVTMHTLLDDDFESYPVGLLPLGLPDVDSTNNPSLSGDPSVITGAVTQGADTVSPGNGSRMLQFKNTYHRSPNVEGVNGDLYYLFDLSSHAAGIATGNMSVSLSAWFNTGAYGMHTDQNSPEYGKVDNAYFLGLSAWTGDVSEYPVEGRSRLKSSDYLGNATNIQNPLVTDRDASTWQQSLITFVLPTGTDYVAARLAAHENMYSDSFGSDFVSSFADDVSVNLIDRNGLSVPESASSVFLLSLACAGITVARRSMKS